MEKPTEKGKRVAATSLRSRSIAAELYRLRVESLAERQVQAFQQGKPQQPIVLQGIIDMEVLTIESMLLHYEKKATRQALFDARKIALGVANEPELMKDGAENPIALKVLSGITDLIRALDDGDEEDDEEAEEAKVDWTIEPTPVADPGLPEDPKKE